MKVWIVIGSYDYEGYAAPTGVYSSEEKANEALKHCRGDNRDIMEYEIDVTDSER